MNRKHYHTNEFAKIASVSVRTLQFYDKKGLLSPTDRTESGHRLYSDSDLAKLQQILTLKYLGFSLIEIKGLIQAGASELPSAVRMQKEMLLDKRRQIDTIIAAIEQIEQMENGTLDYEAIVKIIEVTRMELKPEWVNKYLTTNERRTMRDLAKASYSKEALSKLAQKEFTEDTHQQYVHFRDELRRLVAINVDPSSEEAQRLAEYLTDLNRQLSQGWNEEILAGMKKSWEGFNALPEDKKPKIYHLTDEERWFIKRACAILQERKLQNGQKDKRTE